MIHKQVEDYVDDLVVKAKTTEEHLVHLKQLLRRCREYGLKMNPLKCAFGVSSRKFLGFLVHQRGIDLNPTKAKTILEMNPPGKFEGYEKLCREDFLPKAFYTRTFRNFEANDSAD